VASEARDAAPVPREAGSGVVSERRILLLTRNYPPVRGGMEQYSFDLYENLSRLEDVTLFANRRGKLGLLRFLPAALLHLLRHRGRYTHVHFGDAALSPLLVLMRAISKARLSLTTYGLDVVYRNPLYQRLVPRWVARADAVVCISRATLEQCVARGIPRERCVAIPCGIDFRRPAPGAVDLATLERRHGFRVEGRRLLFSIARLVPRKGHAWFVSEVMPLLGEGYLFVLAGAGPERGAIEDAAAKRGLRERVVLLGGVAEEEKLGFYDRADLFVMPNQHVEGDLEGFGITLIEAAARGLPSIASRTDGIPDAVIEGGTGYLVAEGDAEAFAERIRSCRLARDEVRSAAEAAFSWAELARRYAEVLRGEE
jgi:glycosyltransferase involved in cell wall biosynthesis